MEYFLMFVGVVIIVIALSIFVKLKLAGTGESESVSETYGKKTGGENSTLVQCPLCNSFLKKGENLASKIFRPMNTPDQRMTVQGCPHCYPFLKPGIQRKCPVCGREVPQDGELIARLFNRTEGKKHVMITGCSKCCSGKYS